MNIHKQAMLARLAALCVVATWVTGTQAAAAWAPGPGWTVGGGAAYHAPNAGLGHILVEREVVPYAALRLEAFAGGSPRGLAAGAWAGPYISFDMCSWVPALFLGAGWQARPNVVAGTARLELWHYVSLRASLGAGVGLEWAARSPMRLQTALAVRYAF